MSVVISGSAPRLDPRRRIALGLSELQSEAGSECVPGTLWYSGSNVAALLYTDADDQFECKFPKRAKSFCQLLKEDDATSISLKTFTQIAGIAVGVAFFTPHVGTAEMAAKVDVAQKPTATTALVQWPLSAASDEPEWMRTTYQLLALNNLEGALHSMFRGTESLLRDGKFSEVNAVLRTAQLSQLTPESMVALVRSTYRARSVLPAWNGLLHRVQTFLASQNVPSYEKLLIGLSPWVALDKNK